MSSRRGGVPPICPIGRRGALIDYFGAARPEEVALHLNRIWGSAPSPILQVCLVGFGHAGELMHAPAVSGLRECELAAVVEPSVEGRRRASSLIGAERVYQSLEQALADARLDIVVVCSPPHAHHAAVVEALGSGCHVLCEKPLTNSVQTSRDLLRHACVSRVRMVHNYLVRPEVVSALEIVSKGLIGRVRSVEVSLMGVKDLPGVAFWQPNWRHDKAIGGGGVLADMSHVIYLICSFMGPVYEVVASAETVPVEKGVFALLKGEDATATLAAAWGSGGGHFKVTGDQGRLELAFEHGGTLPFAAFEEMRLYVDEVRIPVQVDHGHGAERLFHRELYESLLRFDLELATAAWGLHVLEVVDSAYQSILRRSWTSVEGAASLLIGS